MMIIIIIITLIRKFLKRVDNLTSSGLLQVSWSHPGAMPTGQQPYAELELTGVVKMLYIYAEYHEYINEKYLNTKITVSSFFIFITPLYWRARFKNGIEVVK